MKKYNQLTFSQKIQWRIRFLWVLFLFMIVYMVAIVELGGGDSRIMTPLADSISRMLFFGGLIYILFRISNNKKLLKNQKLLKSQQLIEQDERNQYLHDKSGGIVWDILFLLLLFITWTASLFNMAAFYTAFVILLFTLVLKLIVYFLYSKCYS